MSQRGDRGEGHARRPGRSGGFGTHRGGSGGKGGGGGGGGPPLPSSGQPPLSVNRSFKRPSNVPGGHQRVNQADTSGFQPAPAPTPPRAPAPQNGTLHAHLPQHPSHHHDTSGVPPSSAASEKPANVPLPRNSSHAVPKAPSSHPATSKGSDSSVPSGASKGDPSKAFNLQFGSINPGIMNNLQIPARTSSAPPNLDEQKRNQALHEAFKVEPTMPLPSVPKQQQQQQHQPTRKDAVGSSQSHTVQSHIPSQAKRDMHAPPPSVPNVAPPRPTVQPIAGMPMPIPFHHQQPQVPLQFGGPNPQMQPQGVVPSSLQMSMALPGSNAPQVPQQIYVPNIQPHALQQQAMMHQGQGLSFVPSAGHQLAPQLGNLGMGMAAQYPQQQPNKYVGPRKTTVKITHPDTHEELKLDKRTDSYMDGVSGQRALPNVTPQSQPVPSFAPHMGFYPSLQPNSYNPSSMYFPSTTTVSQMPTGPQGPRFNFPVSQTGQQITFINPSILNTIPGGSLDNIAGPATSAQAQITARPHLGGLHMEKPGASSVTISAPPGKSDAPKLRPSDDAAPHRQKDNEVASGSTISTKSASEQETKAPSVTDKHPTAVTRSLSMQGQQPETSPTPITPVADSEPVLSGADGKEKKAVRRTDSFKDNQKKATKKDARSLYQQPQSAASDSSEDTNPPTFVKGSAGDGSVQQAAKSSDKELDSASRASVSPASTVESKIASEVGRTELDNASINAGGVPVMNSEKSIPLSTGELLVAQGGENLADVESIKSEISGKISPDLSEAKTYSDSTANELPGVSSVDSAEQGVVGTSSSVKLDARDHGTDRQQLDISTEPTQSGSEEDVTVDKSTSNAMPSSDLVDSDVVSSSNILSADAAEESSVQNANDNECNPESNQNTSSAVFSITPSGALPVTDSVTSESAQKPETGVKDQPSAAPTASIRQAPKEKPMVEITRTKSATGKKKKRKEMLSKADAAGTSDLYNAYKGPEEKTESLGASECVDSSSTVDATHVQPDESEREVNMSEEDGQSKVEPDDWEDAADLSTPKLQTSDSGDRASGTKNLPDEDTTETNSRKTYSRDFLLTFAQQYTDLPIGFQIGSDVADVLMSGLAGKPYVADREPYPSPARVIDRPSSRGDRRGTAIDDDKWTKLGGPFSPGRDSRLDMVNGPAVMNFRPVPGVSHGVLRNPRGQQPSQYISGILAGPMQSIASQLPRSGSDADRWQQRGLIPSPVTPMQIMHKAEKKYEVGKVSDQEEAKQRQLKGILNKLTPQNFDKLFAQVKEVNIDNVGTLTGVISQIFDKALMEPTFCEMYANFCFHLAGALPDFSEDNEKITFKRLLLNKCQEEFERGEREEAEADKTEEEGEVKQTKEEREEKRIRARRRMLGNIRLIGELYKKRMLTERIMHECIKKLLGNYQNPDEEDVEALCKLMSTIGEMIDHPKAKEHMDAYFDIMHKLSTNQKLSSRVRFMLRDSIDLRRNKWQQRRKVEGPKKIDEVHRDAAQERQAQSSRLARGPVVSSVPRRGAPMDYGSRGSTAALASPGSQQVGIRGMPPQVRAFGTQDVRFEERHQFDSRTVPLPQRSLKDDSITLGPQGGLARGMSIRGQPPMSNTELPSVVDHRRMVSGPNGYNSVADWRSLNAREDPNPAYTADRSSGAPYDQSSVDDRNTSWNSRMPDRTPDRAAPAVQPAGRTHGPPSTSQDGRSEIKSFSEEDLREKSLAAIREYYSAKDEKEVALCIEELNAPSFYPSVVSLWVNDSFERKDTERELLAKLLVSLCNGQDGLLSQSQLIQGLRSVLATLEDALSDAPKAAEYLGRLLARFILENILPLREVGRLIQEGGEEPGCLVDIGIAANVLGGVFESIRVEKGDSSLNEIRTSSNLKLEDFRPPHLKRSKLDAFM